MPEITNDVESTAAQSLEGLTLENGWKVIKKLQRKPYHTGGHFCVPYIVERKEEKGFLKAFDFSRFFSKEVTDIIDALELGTSSFRYERDISSYCKGAHVTKVSIAKESGSIDLIQFRPLSNVPYLIFDLANGDKP